VKKVVVWSNREHNSSMEDNNPYKPPKARCERRYNTPRDEYHGEDTDWFGFFFVITIFAIALFGHIFIEWLVKLFQLTF